MTDHESDEPDPEALRDAARKLTCPRCGMPPGAGCKWDGDRLRENLHPERLSKAAGGPEHDGLPKVPWRSPGGNFRWRRLDEDEAA